MTTPPEPPEHPPPAAPPPSSPPPSTPPPTAAVPVPAPAPGATWGAPALSPADRVRRAWSDRVRTDYLFMNPWLNVFLMIITCGIYGLYLFYQLVRRSRDHNQRRLELLDAATTFAWERAYERGVAEELRPSFERIAAHLQPLRSMTTEFRDPAIWLVLALIANGIAQIVAFVLLDGDLIKHDQAEGAVEAELAVIYARLGQPLPPSDPNRVKGPDNYVGRVIATVASCGIYSFWWWVDQQNDGDRHYAQNWPWEDALAQAVNTLQPA